MFQKPPKSFLVWFTIGCWYTEPGVWYTEPLTHFAHQKVQKVYT